MMLQELHTAAEYFLYVRKKNMKEATHKKENKKERNLGTRKRRESLTKKKKKERNGSSTFITIKSVQVYHVNLSKKKKSPN